MLAGGTAAASESAPLRWSVYATAGDVLRYLSAPAERERVLQILRPLQVTRVFLEGRRGDEYVPPSTLREVREFLSGHGMEGSGGIATVPGGQFGTRQVGALDWLNWESKKTQQDVAGFFSETAPVFSELIVDDFYCTADTSPASDSARAGRSWSRYRRDLLVSLLDPMIVRPARATNPSVRLILKFPQWYDRFHLFGYDPGRMAIAVDQVWVGTEVRNPDTQRMGFVQPTEGYMNFLWIRAVAGVKVVGAWFDHIECEPGHFVDQAYQSVLAGAREITLFHLGAVMEKHPGDVLLASRLRGLAALSERVRSQPHRDGIAFYKPPGSDPEDNTYLMDYLGMIGLPILPEACYPEAARVVLLAAQAASDPDILAAMNRSLERGAQLIVTPAFIRKAGPAAAQLAGVQVAASSLADAADEVRCGRTRWRLNAPMELDASVQACAARTLLAARAGGREVPWLTRRRHASGRVWLLNVRTFAEEDFRQVGEWLLAPRRRGLSQIPTGLVDEIRRRLLPPLAIRFQGPVGVELSLFDDAACLYSFREDPVELRVDGRKHSIAPHQALWIDARKGVIRL